MCLTVKVSAATFNKLVEKLTAPKDHGEHAVVLLLLLWLLLMLYRHVICEDILTQLPILYHS